MSATYISYCDITATIEYVTEPSINSLWRREDNSNEDSEHERLAYNIIEIERIPGFENLFICYFWVVALEFVIVRSNLNKIRNVEIRELY